MDEINAYRSNEDAAWDEVAKLRRKVEEINSRENKVSIVSFITGLIIAAPLFTSFGGRLADDAAEKKYQQQTHRLEACEQKLKYSSGMLIIHCVDGSSASATCVCQ